MQKALVFVGLGALVLIIGFWTINRNLTEAPDNSNNTSSSETSMTTFTLSSSAFVHEGMLPSKYTCDGEDMSPPLSWSGVPEGTRSLALTMDDPDAPRGTWDHWVAFNISPTLHGVEEGTEPSGVAGKNSGGKKGYGGPCPPSGTHRYFFHLYALDTELPLEEGATKQDVLAAMEGHVLGSAELMGTYQRQ